jgi:hypothetical protein
MSMGEHMTMYNCHVTSSHGSSKNIMDSARDGGVQPSCGTEAVTRGMETAIVVADGAGPAWNGGLRPSRDEKEMTARSIEADRLGERRRWHAP